MTRDYTELRDAALALPADARRTLAEELLDSVAHADGDCPIDPSWRGLVDERIAQSDAGEVAGIPWTEVRRSGEEAIRNRQAARGGDR